MAGNPTRQVIDGIVSRLGGPANTARLLRLNSTAVVCNWRRRGRIPRQVRGRIVAAVHRLGIELSVSEACYLRSLKITPENNDFSN